MPGLVKKFALTCFGDCFCSEKIVNTGGNASCPLCLVCFSFVSSALLDPSSKTPGTFKLCLFAPLVRCSYSNDVQPNPTNLYLVCTAPSQTGGMVTHLLASVVRPLTAHPFPEEAPFLQIETSLQHLGTHDVSSMRLEEGGGGQALEGRQTCIELDSDTTVIGLGPSCLFPVCSSPVHCGQHQHLRAYRVLATTPKGQRIQ